MQQKRTKIFLLLFLLVCLLFSCQTTDIHQLKQQALEQYPLEQPFAESSFIYIKNTRLHIRMWENETGVMSKGWIILVHGVSGSSYNWRFLAPALAESGWKVLAVDLPPFGYSGEIQENGSMDPLAKDSPARAELLWATVDYLTQSDNSSIVLLGHSLGGRIAAHMALAQPERIEKLILLAPAVYGKSAIPSFSKLWPFNRIVRNHADLLMDNPGVVKYVMKRAYGRKVNQEEYIGNLAPFLRPGVIDACGEWAVESIDTAAPEMQSIAAETLILWSRRDSIVHNQGNKLQSDMQHARFIELPGKSHCIMDTQGELVSSWILEFIAE